MGNVVNFKRKESQVSDVATIYTYWKFDNVLDDETVDKILKLGESEWETAITNDDSGEAVRKTDIIWNNEQWLYDLFWPYMMRANHTAGWNLELPCAEAFQLGRYEDGGHYDFHVDSMGFDRANNPDSIMHGTSRKLSMVCWLNEDFEGGEFEIHKAHVGNSENNIFKPTKGTIVFFPSWMLHKVHPVTEGTRYSLVTWFRGQPVK